VKERVSGTHGQRVMMSLLHAESIIVIDSHPLLMIVIDMLHNYDEIQFWFDDIPVRIIIICITVIKLDVRFLRGCS
jgi:hypothetical protein